MASLSSLTEDVYDMLFGVAQVERPAEDTLKTAVSAADDVSWQMDTAMWKRGDYAEDMSAGELVVFGGDYTVGVDVTVRRGQRGTTAAASYAAGDVFYKNPTFPRHVIERFIQETVDGELYPHVYMWGEATIDYVDGTTTYEMPSDCEDVVAVYQVDLNGTGEFHPVSNSNWGFVNVVNTTESSTGNYLRLHKIHDSAETVYVTYKQRPDSSSMSDLSEDVAALIPWRVVGKLLAGTRVSPARVAPGRSQPVAGSGDRIRKDSSYFDVEFRRMRKNVTAVLRQQSRDRQRRRRSDYVRRG